MKQRRGATWLMQCALPDRGVRQHRRCISLSPQQELASSELHIAFFGVTTQAARALSRPQPKTASLP
ncbi:hypothetical protein, partial [Mesorhizobium sp.]|uniref:hypothetical protein n=1 Tax=Mesorhizobium sp. TaxID=1871066 RepID=UPI00257F3E32